MLSRYWYHDVSKYIHNVPCYNDNFLEHDVVCSMAMAKIQNRLDIIFATEIL